MFTPPLRRSPLCRSDVRPVSIRLHVVIEVLRKQFVGLRSHTNEVRSEAATGQEWTRDKKVLPVVAPIRATTEITGLKNLVSEHFGVACAVGDALPIDVSILDVRDSPRTEAQLSLSWHCRCTRTPDARCSRQGLR